MATPTNAHSKVKSVELPKHVSLFPMPPWQLISKYNCPNSAPRPPTPPTTAYRVFGNFCHSEDTVLRSLESQGVRRVYPHAYNRKRELKKLNFSILANYLDLLDIITRDPSSQKRIEKLDHLAILFINMHHLVNEYRQHQARDLLREVLNYQVNVASESVHKAEQYLSRSDSLLRTAGQQLTLPGHSLSVGSTSCVDSLHAGLASLGPDLAPVIQRVLNETQMINVWSNPPTEQMNEDQSQLGANMDQSEVTTKDEMEICPSHIDESLWRFLLNSTDGTEELDGVLDLE